MGQYHYIVNTTKQEYLNPHKFGAGLKFMEFTSSTRMMTGFALLLAEDNGKGMGDHRARGTFGVGSWAGDSIHIAGDYGVNRYDFEYTVEDMGGTSTSYDDANLFTLCRYNPAYTDISVQVLRLLAYDEEDRRAMIQIYQNLMRYAAERGYHSKDVCLEALKEALFQGDRPWAGDPAWFPESTGR